MAHMKSITDFCKESNRPELLSQWATDLNDGLTPNMVSYGSNQKFWWCCELGHTYQTAVCGRTLDGTGCPYCAGKKVLPGYNDLATIQPAIAAQWHPTLNGELSPADVICGSHRKVWWFCKRGHEWKTEIKLRVEGTDCPYCTRFYVQAGFNDLATTNPEIAAQWHPTKNGDLIPQQVLSGSGKKVWWLCEKGHEWEATVNSRNKNGCPICSGKKVLVGYNDLATQNPVVASKWHPTRNGTLTPDQVTVCCNKKVWWQCSLGHEWQSVISVLTNRNSGCPYCVGKLVMPGFNDLATLQPEIAAQWHPTLNNDLTPELVRPGSHKQVWWQCKDGHVWKAVIYSRAGTDRSGCPVCAGTVNGKRLARYQAMLAEVGLEATPPKDSAETSSISF